MTRRSEDVSETLREKVAQGISRALLETQRDWHARTQPEIVLSEDVQVATDAALSVLSPLLLSATTVLADIASEPEVCGRKANAERFREAREKCRKVLESLKAAGLGDGTCP